MSFVDGCTMGISVRCKDCGDTVYREASDTWKVRCITCFKKSKRAESEPIDSHWKDRATAAESLAATLKRQLEQQQQAIQALMKQQRPVSSFDREFAEHWRALVQHVHPDKHGGSPGATRLTQWLVGIKGRLPCV